jgi:predicted CXXCH cytochrome family protein
MSPLPRGIVRPVMNKLKRQAIMMEFNMIRNLRFTVYISVLVLILSWWNNTAHAEIRLKGKVPDLCFDCHKELRENLSDQYVHFMFRQGKCIACHNSHVSKIKGLMIDEINTLCLGCHEDMKRSIETTNVHSALREYDCTKCHYAHSGRNKSLLVKTEKELCLGCHEDLNRQLNDPYICKPFKEGKCSLCHNAHASSEDNLLIAEPAKLCKECHWPKCKAGEVSIASVIVDVECTTCHSGHGSVYKGVLGPFGHTAFLEERCDECHNPIKDERKISTKIEGEDLCFECHKRATAKYKYISNDIHVKDAKNPCIVCHDYHASDNKNLTKNESRLCNRCHESVEKRTAAMERALRSIKCKPVKERRCFECHIPTHSDRPFDYRADENLLCARCHAAQHKITHPIGVDVIDPRNGQPVTCNSCHSSHSANAEFMLTHDRKRALCIQCHKM